MHLRLNGESNYGTNPCVFSGGSNFYIGTALIPVASQKSLTGYIQEIIVFSIDYSANQLSIELNLNTHYSIY